MAMASMSLKVLGYTRPGNLQVDTKKTQDQFPSNRCFMGIPRLSYWESPDSTDWTSMETVLWPELAGTVSHGAPYDYPSPPFISMLVLRKNSISQPATVDYPGGYLISQVVSSDGW